MVLKYKFFVSFPPQKLGFRGNLPRKRFLGSSTGPFWCPNALGCRFFWYIWTDIRCGGIGRSLGSLVSTFFSFDAIISSSSSLIFFSIILNFSSYWTNFISCKSFFIVSSTICCFKELTTEEWCSSLISIFRWKSFENCSWAVSPFRSFLSCSLSSDFWRVKTRFWRWW